MLSPLPLRALRCGASAAAASSTRGFCSLVVRARPVFRTRLVGSALSSPAASAAAPSAAAALPLASAPCSAIGGVRHSTSASKFKNKKQKEYKTRLARGFKALKTHAGCKKRFRFVGRFAIACKHAGKYHKNYTKRGNRLRRLRPMKIVPRNIVKRIKVMMPYWRRQLARECQYQRVVAEASVKLSSTVSLDRQRSFIDAQNARLKQQLLNPTSYFPQNLSALARRKAISA